MCKIFHYVSFSIPLIDCYVSFFLILFYLTLQYCIGFAIYQNESAQVYMCSPSWTPLLPPFPYHPSGSSQCTSPKHPISCIEPGLATHFIYDIIHISMPFSKIYITLLTKYYMRSVRAFLKPVSLQKALALILWGFPRCLWSY